MIKSTRLIYALIFLTITACNRRTNVIDEDLAIDHQMLAGDVLTLAADNMEGREVGTEGELKAANYIIKRMQEIGLSPAGTDGYIQKFSRTYNANPHGDENQNGDGPKIEGRNILGYLDNGAQKTVIIGGHYDHLGFGHEGSLYSGPRAIHNGADDNASGTSGVLFLASRLKKQNLKNYNYLFICFSGEEKGLWGSNYYVKSLPANHNIAYMVNMDMIGRLNKDKQISISGVGTSPVFTSIIDGINYPKFSIKKELSGLGPSDHASFYNSGIPVLAFFTGQHKDYHKPSDDSNLINYKGMGEVLSFIEQVVLKLENIQDLPFTKTKDENKERISFSVTLGVMPDYLYDGKGMKIDGVKDEKPAQRAGMMQGDIVIKMGELDVPDMQAYMKCLSFFKPGQKVPVTIIRDGKERIIDVQF
jgi:hypothetical protein